MENNISREYFYSLLLPIYKEEFIINTVTEKYIVRSLSMANWLCSNGHKILKVEDSEKNPKFKVFLFEDTPDLHNTMAKFRKEV